MRSVGEVWQERILEDRDHGFRALRRAAPKAGRGRPEHHAYQPRQDVSPSLRQRAKCVSIARHDFFRLLHLFLETGIVRCETIIAIRGLNEKKLFSVARLQAIDHVLRQNNTKRVTEFSDLEFDHCALPLTLLQW